ncbi:hypothetical protein TNCV_90261 [Trichonephila clavipes]|nr:hypothetical protein TNCV_90261 [Trichonephila clavipes]
MRAKAYCAQLSVRDLVGPEVHEQMFWSDGQSDAKPPVLNSQASLVLFLSTTQGLIARVNLVQTKSIDHARLDAGHKGQSLQDVCRRFAWNLFFQTQQQGHEQAEEPLSAYVIMRLVPNCDPVQMFCGGLGRPFLLTVPLVWN